ncbi:hypothetical protein IGJ94_002302 [Enterococcus sp. AZ153]|uniref:hypothetical protein n=1 Tax=unclassified Enterococcus TaxID=2608891 RepID=UPI003F2148D6
MTYTVQQEHQILNLIRLRRKELQDDRAALRKADELSDRQAELIATELEDLRKFNGFDEPIRFQGKENI